MCCPPMPTLRTRRRSVQRELFPSLPFSSVVSPSTLADSPTADPCVSLSKGTRTYHGAQHRHKHLSRLNPGTLPVPAPAASALCSAVDDYDSDFEDDDDDEDTLPDKTELKAKKRGKGTRPVIDGFHFPPHQRLPCVSPPLIPALYLLSSALVSPLTGSTSQT